MAGERLMEALDAGIADLALLREYAQAKATRPNLAPPARNPVFVALGNISAEKHVLTTAQRIKASHLQDALLVLPFEKVVSFLTFLDIWAQKEWHISLTCRILFFLLKTHHKQIVASKTMRAMLDSVRANLRAALRHQKDEMGFNLAAVKFVKSGVDQRGVSEYVDEEAFKMQEERATKKRGFATLA